MIRWPWNAPIKTKTPAESPYTEIREGTVFKGGVNERPTTPRPSPPPPQRSDPPILPAPMRVQITGACEQIGLIAIPVHMYGSPMLMVWDEEKQAWARMRAEDADRVVRALENVANALNAWKGAV